MKEKLKKFILPSVVTLAFMALYFYLALPALNLRAGGMWLWLALGAIVFFITYTVKYKPTFFKDALEFFGIDLEKITAPKVDKNKGVNDYYVPRKKLPKGAKIALIVIAAVLAVFLIACAVTSTRLFRASAYQSMLTVTESDFATDIAEIPMEQVPVVDRDTAERLGSRKIGEVVELVSQFDVSSYYSQINYNGKPYRVSPLEYAGFLKWISNSGEGVPYYVTIDMATQNTELVKLKEPTLDYMRRQIKRGINMGIFRSDADEYHTVLSLMSFCFSYFSNIHTMSAVLERNMTSDDEIRSRAEYISEIIIKYLQV